MKPGNARNPKPPVTQVSGEVILAGDGEGLSPQPAPTFSPKQPQVPLVPGYGEIAALPKLARVAFNARCARRVLSAYNALWIDAPREYAPILQTAVTVAEQVGMGFCLPDIEKVIKAAYKTAADSRDPAWYAANAAAYAVGTAADPNSSEMSYAISNAARVLFETATIDTPLTAQLRCIRRDFARLKRFAREQKWTDDTPVPPDVFGPMWPDGAEPYWAVAPPPTSAPPASA